MKPTSDWRSLIKVHPAAEMFPTMEGDDLKDLAEDIKANGLTSPVTTLRDKDGTEWLLDGRNRLDAMALAGYQFKRHSQLISSGDRRGQREPERFKVLSPKGASHWAGNHVSRYFGTDPYTYVVSANINRRHLTAAQKSDLIAALLKAKPERSDRATAKIAKVHNETVASVRAELEGRDEIRHLAPTDRVDPRGRKSARKTANGRIDNSAWTDERIDEYFNEPGLADRARKLAAMPSEEFEEHVQRVRQAVRTDSPVEEEASVTQASTVEPTALSEHEQAAFMRVHPNVMKGSREIERAFKRCSPEEQQFLCKYTLPRILDWYRYPSDALDRTERSRSPAGV